MVIGSKYIFKYSNEENPEPMVYVGERWVGNGWWHQFTKNGAVWSELRDSDLKLIEFVEE